jgi:hypothetical protein
LATKKDVKKDVAPRGKNIQNMRRRPAVLLTSASQDYNRPTALFVPFTSIPLGNI